MKIDSNPIIKKLLKLNLPRGDFAIFGSGIMYAHGLKDLGHDVDVIARGKAWKKAQEYGEAKQAYLGKNKVVVLYDGEIEIFDGWAPGKWNVNELIDNAEIFDGIKFVGLKNVIKWKKIFRRDKDLQHIKMIENYLKNK